MTNPHDPSSTAVPQSGAQTGAKPSPKPGPKPGPRPGAQVAGKAAPKPVVPAATHSSNPAEFGRVDADGTAWVKTSDGERQVGVYQAGTPEEGLAHFGARFDALSTEIAVLEARLSTHPEEAVRIRKDAAALRESLPTAAVIGDIASLDTRLEKLGTATFDAEKQAEQMKIDRRNNAIATKEKLASEAEDLAANSTDWKAAGDRFRSMMDEWKVVRGVDRATDDALWDRFSSARESFNKRRGSHFADLDRNRAEAKRKKEDLVERAEALSDSTDWGETARAYKGLMQEWKAAGRAHREADDALWARFRAAQDKFFDARTAENSKRDAEFEDNAAQKQSLIDEYDAKVNPAEGIDKAKAALRELQEKWEAIGYVPRNRVREFEDMIGALEARVSEAEAAEWRKTDPEVQARVAQFQAKVDQLNAEAEAAEAKGKPDQAAKLREQAKQWSEWAKAAANAVEN